MQIKFAIFLSVKIKKKNIHLFYKELIVSLGNFFFIINNTINV